MSPQHVSVQHVQSLASVISQVLNSATNVVLVFIVCIMWVAVIYTINLKCGYILHYNIFHYCDHILT